MEIYEEIRADREKGARRLVAEYRERLQTAAQLLTNDAHAAEDLVFRAFEQAIKKVDEFRPTGSFYYWIYTILLNFHRMDLRKKASRPQIASVEEVPDKPVEDALFNEFKFRGTAEAVRTAVSKLPENFREVVVLRYFEEMSTGEIAKVAGVPEGTVRSRLHYAKDALYAMLKDTELDPEFADRLVRAVRPKHWLFRRSMVASLAVLLCLALGAALTIANIPAPLVSNNQTIKPSNNAPAEPETPQWKVAASAVSTFSPEADEIDKAVEQGLKYLASQQKEDGVFHGAYGDTAAIPALVGMAILSKGHLPGSEPYGEVLNKCLDRVLATADLSERQRFRGYFGSAGNGRLYAHSIATLFVSEVSGMVDMERQARIDQILPLAVKVILDAQAQHKHNQAHLGGWRYTPDAADSDLSCSGWALMALRSARLNGAELPEDAIEKAVLYIRRTQNEGRGWFSYQGNDQFPVTLTGAGILCLELCGRHLDPASLKAAKYLGEHYKRELANQEHCLYGIYYASQGLFQLGGETWKDFEAWMVEKFLKEQRANGSWGGRGNEGSDTYATAMAVLSLTVPYRMLPIYQRDETVDGEEEAEGENKEKKKS